MKLDHQDPDIQNAVSIHEVAESAGHSGFQDFESPSIHDPGVSSTTVSLIIFIVHDWWNL